MTIRHPTLHESITLIPHIHDNLRGQDQAYDTLISAPLKRWLARTITLPFYLHFLNDPWVLVLDSTMAGWLHLQHAQRSTHINNLGVLPAYRRQGWATALIGWAEQQAAAKGSTALTLAVTVRNDPAVQLYAKLGFRTVHHTLWEGNREILPLCPSTIVPRELDANQRHLPFQNFWSVALDSDGIPVEPLLADQIAHWHTKRGRAWELWQQQTLIGYVDIVGNLLRLFIGSPSPETIQATWSALARFLPTGPLLLDVGSATHHEAMRPFLEPFGWVSTPRDRMLMVKPLRQTKTAAS